jgi:aryl-alcohol dehydrogenase-like predicted oxidoreductase
MEQRTFGRTGWQVSAVGFGAWGIGGGMWSGADDEQSLQALRAALESGCTFIDTALAYGEGHSERLIGRALDAWKSPVTVATKVPPMNRLWPARRGVGVEHAFPAGYLVRSAETSAANLGRPVDLLQLHVWRDAWLGESAWREGERAISRLLGAGTIRAFGISVNDHQPDEGLEAVRRCDLVSGVQVIYNIWDQRPARALLPLCREKNVGVIARVPFDEGGLTGRVTRATTFPDGDFRNIYFTPRHRAQLEPRVKRLAPVLLREAGSLAEGALRFCLSHPDVSTVIPGMRTVEHARANCAVADGRALSPALLGELKQHAWPRNWYPGSWKLSRFAAAREWLSGLWRAMRSSSVAP